MPRLTADKWADSSDHPQYDDSSFDGLHVVLQVDDDDTHELAIPKYSRVKPSAGGLEILGGLILKYVVDIKRNRYLPFFITVGPLYFLRHHT